MTKHLKRQLYVKTISTKPKALHIVRFNQCAKRAYTYTSSSLYRGKYEDIRIYFTNRRECNGLSIQDSKLGVMMMMMMLAYNTAVFFDVRFIAHLY